MNAKSNFQKKIEILEIQKKELIQKRISEITLLIEKLDLLSLDNDLIIGALSQAKEAQESKNKTKLEELKASIPSRFRKTKRPTKESESKAA